MLQPKYLMLALDSRRLYLLGDEQLRKAVVGGGAFRAGAEYIKVVELASSLILSISPETLVSHLLPDNRVYQELRLSRITGMRPTVPLRAGVHPLPLSGNLNNPSWMSVCLGGRCDSNCAFCFTEFIRNDKGLEFDEAVRALECGRQAKVEIVVFSGGEPTLCKDLFELIKSARKLGYRQVGIQTNGHRLSSKEYMNSLIDAGLSNVLLSLHAPNASAHDDLTRTPNSFGRATQALKHLANTLVDTTVNFVVCRDNGPLSLQMVEFVASQNNKATLRFSFLIVEGAAHNHVQDVLPTLPEFVDWIGGALARAGQLGLPVEVDNVPPCISHALGVSESYTRSRRRSLMDASPFYAAERNRGEFDVKLEACNNCKKSADCCGIQMAYLANIRDGADHVFPVG